jgi:hypothetical protein
LINKRITFYLENENLLADEQNGFRRGRSCEDHIFTLNSLARNQDNLHTAFIDLRKAFDFVDRDMLFYKLLLNGIDGKVYNAVKSMYKHTISCIRINNNVTSWFDCKSGVAQGSNLSPTLFAIFVNDLVREINDLELGVTINNASISILLYADDIALIAKSEIDLQKMLDTLHEWCKKWRVLINTEKSKCLHFRKPRLPRTQFNYHVGNNTLDVVTEYKYLGVIFDEMLSFKSHCEAIGKAASRAFGGLINKIHGITDFGFKSYEKLVFNCVVPVMDYCSSIWGYKTYQQIDNVHNRSMRYYLGVHRYAPIAALSGDLGWVPSRYRRWLNMLRFWNRLINFDSDRITKLVFDQDYMLCNNNWCSEIKSIMTSLDLSHAYYSRSIIDLQTAELKLKTLYSRQWIETVQNTPKLRTYKLFKCNFNTEDYVLFNLSKYERSIIAQFRCGILPLRVETGRYIGEPLNDRLCRLCNDSCVENEVHFLLNCPKYNEIRSQSFGEILNDNVFMDLNVDDKLIFLFSNHVRKIAKYLVKAYLHRRNIIYRNTEV